MSRIVNSISESVNGTGSFDIVIRVEAALVLMKCRVIVQVIHGCCALLCFAVTMLVIDALLSEFLLYYIVSFILLHLTAPGCGLGESVRLE